MKKLIYMLSLLAVVLVFSSFTEDVMAKKEKAKTEKVSKKAKKAKKEKKSKQSKKKSKAQKKKKVLVESSSTNAVWMFGFSASFTDSIIYMTDIQMIPKAKVKKKTKFLEGSADYANQLKQHLEENLNMTNRTCAVFYGIKKEKAEKKYMEVRKRYAEQTHLELKYLNATEFKFEQIEEE